MTKLRRGVAVIALSAIAVGTGAAGLAGLQTFTAEANTSLRMQRTSARTAWAIIICITEMHGWQAERDPCAIKVR